MERLHDHHDAIAWRPTDDVVARAQLTRFISFCGLTTFDELYRRSITDIEWFTEQVLRFLDIQFDKPYNQIVDLSRGVEWPRWLIGGRLNIVGSCLDRWEDRPTARQPAVIWEGEEGAWTRELGYDDLLIEVERCAAGLRACGYGRGDAIGIHLPMVPETVIALLAINRIGGIAVPLFSGYGPTAISSRLRDVNAKALFTCDAFPRRGKPVNAKQVADNAVADCPDITRVIVVRRMRVTTPMKPGRDLTWDQLLATGDMAGGEARRIEATGAEDPLIAIYTSGTTGRPKGILHTHCGFPVKSAQDMCFGTDVGQGTRISWITDVGWMMGPWLIYGALILGATIVLYDGAPDFPQPDRLWDFCARSKVEVLGISPTLVRALAAHGDQWVEKHDLAPLRIFGSTGEPWNPDPWWWLFENVGRRRIPIINYSGGTEISGGILMSNPLLPIKPCAFSAPCPGIAADVVDENGDSVRGAVGELVIRNPWIGQARGFWKDEERYLQTYWSRFPNVWVHGDWAMVDADGHWRILGRSDDTLKIAGKRVGPAEVESILVGAENVIEAAAIGVPDELKGAALVAFCVLTPGADGDARLEEELRERVAAELGKPLRPEKIYFVESLPKTRNAKVMRRVIRAAFLGEDPGDMTALENPAAVEAIRQAGK
ncbi:MAG TPA: AMP-binding protein [Blastocatellia bacterium]|jgi:acetyl-CoA synthetase|nr:AMP-binding protein [Blastocatellia bacterium]